MVIEFPPGSIMDKIVGVIFFAIGVYVLISILCDVFRSYQSMTWLPVEAVMIKNGISYSENVSYDQDGIKQTSHVYKPEITYKYEIRGVSYNGNRIYWIDALLGSKHLTAPMHVIDFIGEIDPGEKFTVYFDPTNVKRSVVFRGVSYYGVFDICISLIASALCIYAAITILTRG